MSRFPLVLSALLLAAPAIAVEVAEAPRMDAPALTLPAARTPALPGGLGGGLGGLVIDVLTGQGRLPAIPGLPTSPALRLAAPPAPAAPAASAEPLPQAPAASGAALEPSAVGPERSAPPLGALGPAAGPGRFQPAPLTAGAQAPVAVSVAPAGKLGALGRQAAQTLSEVRALPAAEPGEGAWRLGRRLWEREPARGSAEPNARLAGPGEPTAPARAEASAAASAANAGVRQPKGGAETFAVEAGTKAEGTTGAVANGLQPYAPEVVGRRVAPPVAAPPPALASLPQAAAPKPARPPVPLVALRVAGQSLVLTESLEPLPAGALAASAALAALPQAGSESAARTADAFGGLTGAAADLRDAVAAPASVASASSPGPAASWAAAAGARFSAAGESLASASAPQGDDTGPLSGVLAQLAAAQPWIWLLPMALLAFHYRREYL